jgi:hypothetical protein
MLYQLFGFVKVESFVTKNFIVSGQRANLQTTAVALAACGPPRLSTDDPQESTGLSFLFLLFSVQGTTPWTRRS